MGLFSNDQLRSDVGVDATAVPQSEQTGLNDQETLNDANASVADAVSVNNDEAALNNLDSQRTVQEKVVEQESKLERRAQEPLRMSLTGHRPKDLLTDEQKRRDNAGNLYDYTDIRNGGYAVLHDQLKQQIADQLQNHQQVECHSGMALGADTVWAHAIVNARKEYGADRVKFVADVPCGGQESMWRSNDSQARYRSLLAEADQVNVYDRVTAAEDDKKSRRQQVFKAMMDRDAGLVNNSDVVLAVYNDAYKQPDSNRYHKGGTFATLKNAYKAKKSIVYIDPAKAFENAPQRQDAAQIFAYNYDKQAVIPFDANNATLYLRDQAKNVTRKPFALTVVEPKTETVQQNKTATAHRERKQVAENKLQELQLNYAKLYTNKQQRLVLVTPYTRPEFDKAGVSKPAITNYVKRNGKETSSHQTTMTLTNFNKLMKSTKNESRMVDKDTPDGILLSTYQGDRPIPFKARFQGYRRDDERKFVPSNEAEVKSKYPDQHLYYALVSKDATVTQKALPVVDKEQFKTHDAGATRTVDQDNNYKELYVEQAYLQMSKDNNPYVSFVPRNRMDVAQSDAGEYPINTKYRDKKGELHLMHNSYVNLHWFNEMMRVSGNEQYMIDQNHLKAGTIIGKDDSVPLRARVKLMTKDRKTGNWRALTVDDDPKAVKTKRLLPNTVLKTEFPDFDRDTQRRLRTEKIEKSKQDKAKTDGKNLSKDELMGDDLPF